MQNVTLESAEDWLAIWDKLVYGANRARAKSLKITSIT